MLPCCALLCSCWLIVLQYCMPAASKVVGVWTDIEDLSTKENLTFIDTITQATAEAHRGGLRFAVDAQVGWGFESLTAASTRPTYMDVMDIVDEVTIMDYFSGCNDPLSTEGIPCHITQAMMWLGPFLTYANFLQRTQNRTVLLDVGLGVAFPGPPSDNVSESSTTTQKVDWSTHRFHTELELEKFLHRTSLFLHEMQGGPSSSDPNDIPGSFHTWCLDRPDISASESGKFDCPRSRRGPFNKFAFFEHQNYIGVSGSYPCPRDEAVCAPGVQRPPRALWMYDMVVDTRPGRNDYRNPLCYIPTRMPRSTVSEDSESLGGFQCNVLFDAAARRRFFAWCKLRAIDELYIDANPFSSSNNATMMTALEDFVIESDKQGIDLQFLCGEEAGPAVVNYTRGAADWCLRHKELCGDRARPPPLNL